MSNDQPTIRDLEIRCNALERDIDKFKFVVKFLGAAATAFGITVGSLFLHFQSKYEQLNELEEKDKLGVAAVDLQVRQVGDKLSNLTTLEQKLPALDNQIKILEGRLQQAKSGTMQVSAGTNLQKDILDFESSTPTQPNPWDAYRNDLESLDVLTLRYVGYLSLDPKEDANHALNKELRNAAEAVRSRTRFTESTDTSYTWHVTDTPTNFENLLSELAAYQDQDQLTPQRLSCYRQAFPVWLDNVGLYGKPTKANSSTCNGLLNLSP